MSRNYGLGSRDMISAGRIALSNAASRGELSFASADTIADRWSHLSRFAKNEGIGRMERIDASLVRRFGQHLAVKVKDGQLSAAYTQNLISAVNTVMSLATRGTWESISPTRDCGIPQRSSVRQVAPAGYDRQQFVTAIQALREQGLDRQASVAEFARELGLRSKEGSLLDTVKALKEAQIKGQVTITEGTKGGRSRVVTISSDRQQQALLRAAAAQGDGRNIIPTDNTWKTWREGGLRNGREALQMNGISRYHELRASYACERYRALTGHNAPVLGGQIVSRAIDLAAREQIAAELGHGRIDVVAAYVGGRK